MLDHDRYYVLKRVDLDTALDKGLINPNDVDTLRRIHRSCATARDQVGKKGQDYIVVESDWPIYKTVQEMIEDWVAGRPDKVGIARHVAGLLAEQTQLFINDLANMGPREFRRVIVERLAKLPREDIQPDAADQNTQIMMAERSKALREQEEDLQKNLRTFDKDKAEARNALEAAYEALQTPGGYEALGRVLREAMHQCAVGKGRDRHANGKPFTDQPILALSREYDSPVGLLFQIRKKLDEYDRLDGIARRRELLGALVYLAALIIFDAEQYGYELMPEEKLNVVGYLKPLEKQD